MMTNAPHLKLCVLEGDDIGHEIVPAAWKIAAAAADRTGLRIDWRPLPIGRKALDEHGSTMPAGTLEPLATLDGWILGPTGHPAPPKVPAAQTPHHTLRTPFHLFRTPRPPRPSPG